jgi:hypothetical protein
VEAAGYAAALTGCPVDYPLGFTDSDAWAVAGSGKVKEIIANVALAARQDVVMGVTQHVQLTTKYRSVVEGAMPSSRFQTLNVSASLFRDQISNLLWYCSMELPPDSGPGSEMRAQAR